MTSQLSLDELAAVSGGAPTAQTQAELRDLARQYCGVYAANQSRPESRGRSPSAA